MRKNIFIFTSIGAKPDPYINIICNCVDKFGVDIIEDFHLLKVLELNEFNNPDLLGELGVLRNNILIQLRKLSQCSYLDWDRDSNDFKTEARGIVIDQSHQDLYGSVLNKIRRNEIKTDHIVSDDLANWLERRINNSSYEFITDLTLVDKIDFLKISMVLLSRDSSIYYFKVHRRFSHDEGDLIHNLMVDNKKLLCDHINLTPKGYQINKLEKSISVDLLKAKWTKRIKNGEDLISVLEEIDIELESSRSFSGDEKILVVQWLTNLRRFNKKNDKNLMTNSDLEKKVAEIQVSVIKFLGSF
ncbi:hypothetical protein [Lewinella cohaerens]|uniref:hypothetical protein n=1 Tax=Lewinella cohaerens TaxID=70995 RepID=UPI0003706F50|nr:hypothetical protein [Lewinella cohaerens]